jgi:hypothetical protein
MPLILAMVESQATSPQKKLFVHELMPPLSDLFVAAFVHRVYDRFSILVDFIKKPPFSTSIIRL